MSSRYTPLLTFYPDCSLNQPNPLMPLMSQSLMSIQTASCNPPDNQKENQEDTLSPHNTFAPRLLAWFESHGRHDLPWQQHRSQTPDAYAVWLSEVMLQQTQVATVIPYFERFMASFPTIASLANADWDTVAAHWAGLGYYARARNLHQGAKQLQAHLDTHGTLPQTLDGWQAIRGVGRSTAGAIMAMGLHDYGVICDGNVKRVLTRWAGINGEINKSTTDKQLWALAERLTPAQHSGNFAQAMMDLGSGICTRRKPACLLCPIQDDCIALAEGRQHDYPVKAQKKPKPSKYSLAIALVNPQGQQLWLQRPDSGIWGGLWCLPLYFLAKLDAATPAPTTMYPTSLESSDEAEFNIAEQIVAALIHQHLQTSEVLAKGLPFALKHTLTHFHWYFCPISLTLSEADSQSLSQQLQEADISFVWTDADTAKQTLALPRAMLVLLVE